jgi:hypothetical protein
MNYSVFSTRFDFPNHFQVGRLAVTAELINKIDGCRASISYEHLDPETDPFKSHYVNDIRHIAAYINVSVYEPSSLSDAPSGTHEFAAGWLYYDRILKVMHLAKTDVALWEHHTVDPNSTSVHQKHKIVQVVAPNSSQKIKND